VRRESVSFNVHANNFLVVVDNFCSTQLELIDLGARILLYDLGANTEVFRTEVGECNSGVSCSMELPWR
jgi:hypothetical protein